MSEVVTRRPLADFFRDLVRDAARSQEVTISESAEHYLVHLLEHFARPEPGWNRRPLALDFLESFGVDGTERAGKLRRVGDTSLFLSGVFMEYLERQIVSVDYYISLGSSAYSHLANAPAGPLARTRSLFAEMAETFPELVRVLTDVSFERIFRSERQTVRAYSRWLHTGSQRDARWLMRRGVLPLAPGPDHLRH